MITRDTTMCNTNRNSIDLKTKNPLNTSELQSSMHTESKCKSNKNNERADSYSIPIKIINSNNNNNGSNDNSNIINNNFTNPNKIIDLRSPNSSPSLSTRKSKNLKNLQLNLSNSSSPRNISNITSTTTISNDIPTHTNDVPFPVQKYEINDLSSSAIKTPIMSRTPTPTGSNPVSISPFSHQKPLQHFRRVTSYNSRSPSSSSIGSHNNGLNNNENNNNITLNNSQRKRSTTTLAINIPPVNEFKSGTDSEDSCGPISSISPNKNYGDLLINENTENTTNDINNISSNHNIKPLANKYTDKTTNLNSKKIPNLPFEKPQPLFDNDNQSSLHLSPNSFQSPQSFLSSKSLIQSSSPPIGVNYSSQIKPQTIMHSFDESKIENCNNENFKFAYPNGPICVLEPNLFLYSEPTFEEITGFDVIINVAQEIKDFSNQINEINKVTDLSYVSSASVSASPSSSTSSLSSITNDLQNFEKITIDSFDRETLTINKKNKRNIEYYFIPWTHTSRLTSDFPYLTSLIDKSLKNSKRVLIHCQCGVSRSASLIMAYFMKIYGGGYNDAYLRLKKIVPQISPNLSLIYELIEWGEWLEKGQPDQQN